LHAVSDMAAPYVMAPWVLPKKVTVVSSSTEMLLRLSSWRSSCLATLNVCTICSRGVSRRSETDDHLTCGCRFRSVTRRRQPLHAHESACHWVVNIDSSTCEKKSGDTSKPNVAPRVLAKHRLPLQAPRRRCGLVSQLSRHSVLHARAGLCVSHWSSRVGVVMGFLYRLYMLRGAVTTILRCI